MRVCRRWVTVAAVFVVAVAALAAAPPASAQTNEGPAIHFVVDVSDSMSGNKLAAAIDAITTSVTEDIPAGTAIGLRSYSGDCDQSSVPPRARLERGNGDKVIAAAEMLRAGGFTPTTAALDRGINELLAYGASGPNRIVLVTDGETQCGISVCDFIKNKDLGGVTIRLFTVGLAVTDTAAEDLRCAATATAASSFEATDVRSAESLIRFAAIAPATDDKKGDANKKDADEDETEDGEAGRDSTPADGPFFTTHLFPRDEVPALGGPGHGWSTWQVSSDGKSISYRIVRGGLGEITGAHLHQAIPLQNGPVVVPLDLSNDDGRTISGSFTAENFTGPMQGRLMAGLIGAIEVGAIYINVHTADRPAGAIRGQLAIDER